MLIVIGKKLTSILIVARRYNQILDDFPVSIHSTSKMIQVNNFPVKHYFNSFNTKDFYTIFLFKSFTNIMMGNFKNVHYKI